MISYDKLLQLGFTSDIIDGYLKDGKIIVNEDGYVITNYDLLIGIINKADDSFVFDYSNIQINTMLSNLFRLIRIKQNLLAYELSKRIVDIIEIPEVQLIIDNIDYSEDFIDYIADDKVYTNDVVINGLRRHERNMLLDFYSGDFLNGNKKMIELARLYVSQPTSPFTTYKAYLNAVNDLKTNHTKIGTRKYEGAAGYPLNVLSALLRCEDYVRSHEVIKSVYLDHADVEFSIIWEVLRLMDIELMEEYNKNVEHVYKQIILNSNGLSSIGDIAGKFNVSSLNEEQIQGMDKKYDYSLDYDKNYYNEYLKHKEKGKYEEARTDIIKFQRLMGENGVFCDYDYLIKETDILLYNQMYSSEDDLKKHDELIAQAEECMNNKDYDRAIVLYSQSFNYEAKTSISTYSKIGECYMELGNYEDAVNTFSVEAAEYLYPIDYLHYIESLYRIGSYEEIFELADGYEYYYPSESAFVHYILSICYIMRGNYKLALDQIDTCEIICMEYYNLGLNFNYERGIIKDLERGKDVEPYSLDDYYDHCFSEQTLKRIERLDID
jgi:tetratricopeptide (TPR) repeat protein